MSNATIKNPNKIECTLQFTMRLEDWMQIRKTLNENAAYTELQIINEIDSLVCQLEDTFYPKLEVES